jgi:deazaflavin-dependent oxidoreductase (nitroreductase family)
VTTIELITTGRRSGQARRVKVYALIDGASLLVVGSGWAGRHRRERHPSWALNLRAEPRARVKRGKREYDVLARELEGSERERQWKALCNAFPYYAKFQEQSPRAFAVFSREPIDAN